MFRKYLIPLVSVAFLFSGCAMLRKTEHRKIQSKTIEQPVVESVPEEKEPEPQKKQPTRKPEKQTPIAKEPAKLKPERPTIHFGETESANIKIALYLNNPFPASDELTLLPEELDKEFCYPYKGKMISPYGNRGRSFHSGIDIKAIPNDTIRAAMPGVVRMAKLYSGYGNVIVIRHYNGIETVYSHQSKNLVSVNDVVEAGSPIGLAGRTGRATTEHLHFEVRVASQTIDPRMLVDPDTHALRNDPLYLYNKDGRILAYNHPRDQRPDTDKPSETTSLKSTVAGSAAASPNSGSGSGSGKTSSQTSSSSGKVYHTVKKGDTLSQIARNYSTTVAKICALNGIKSTKILQLKERLRVK